METKGHILNNYNQREWGPGVHNDTVPGGIRDSSLVQISVSGLEAGHERDNKSSFVSSVSGKYLRNCAPNSLRCFASSHLTLSVKNHTMMENLCVVLVNADREELQLLNHSLNFVLHIEYRREAL